MLEYLKYVKIIPKRIMKGMFERDTKYVLGQIYDKLYPVENRRPCVPQHLWLETTNRCNSNCIFCGREHALPPCDMDFDLFKRIVKDNPQAKIVQTQGFGEPLLYPHVVDAVKFSHKPGRMTTFYTNAYALDEDMAQQLLDARLTQINYSVDGADKETYESLRIGLKWETVLENIKRFQKIKEKGGYNTLTVVRMCETKENSHMIPEIVKFWKNIVDFVSVKPEVYIPSPEELRASPTISGPPIKCPNPYQHLSVKSNGDLVLCCRDWFHVYKMGSLVNGTINEVYNNQTFNKTRKALQTGVDYPTMCHYCKVDLPEPRPQ